MSIMDASPRPPQISEMFQKFALAFKSKTIELFAEDGDAAALAHGDHTADGFALLDSAEEFIPDQKVVVIKPDQTHKSVSLALNPQFSQTLISSIFSSISSFESSYLQLQTAHAPFDEENIKLADKSSVQHLQKLSELKKLYKNLGRNPNPDFDFPCGSCLEAEVQENQSKLRTLETAFNRLQSEIDEKGDRVLALRQELGEIQNYNSKVSKLLANSDSVPLGVVMTIRVFESILREASRSLHSFTKLLITLMRKAEWDLDLAANSVYSDVNYAKPGHNRYAFLSYVSLCLFRGFGSEDFGLDVDRSLLNGDSRRKFSLKHLVEHVMCNPKEVLAKSPGCAFSRFCEWKYQELVNPSMELSIFANLDKDGAVLNSWKSVSSFYESYVKMASSIWLLNKLAFSFNPSVEIFQVERGTNFSMVYMEDVTKRGFFPGNIRSKVGFTVIPGFRIGKTIIQSQVYLAG